MKILILLFTVLSCQFAFSYTGGWSGNGGDRYKDQDNTWFLGDQVVEYCIKLPAKTLYPKSYYQKLVHESINEWISFLAKYNILNTTIGSRGTFSGVFPDRKFRKMASVFQEIETCHSDSEQLIFLFGINNAQIDAYLKYNSRSVAVALRGPYNEETYRNAGYIWIDQSLLALQESSKLLKHLLLHELGHVFGMKHDSVFVMNQEVVEQIEKRIFDQSLKYHGAIESPNWHYRMLPGDTFNFYYERGGFLGVPEGFTANSSLPAEVRALFSLSQQGYSSFSLRYGEDEQLYLIIVRENGKKEFYRGKFNLRMINITQSFMGPGIYTKWVNLESTSAEDQFYYQRCLFDVAGSILPQNGYFEVMGKKLATTIDNVRGIEMKMFLPDSGQWWLVGH